MRNLTTSIRNGEWTLYITTLREALPLLFAFDRTNYSCWGCLYYKDCLSLKDKFLQFCKNVNIAQTRKYSIHKLLSFEMCGASFFLTKNGYICKTNKPELTRELEKMVNYVPRVSCRPENPGTLCKLTIIDFMAYALLSPLGI